MTTKEVYGILKSIETSLTLYGELSFTVVFAPAPAKEENTDSSIEEIPNALGDMAVVEDTVSNLVKSGLSSKIIHIMLQTASDLVANSIMTLRSTLFENPESFLKPDMKTKLAFYFAIKDTVTTVNSVLEVLNKYNPVETVKYVYTNLYEKLFSDHMRLVGVLEELEEQLGGDFNAPEYYS